MYVNGGMMNLPPSLRFRVENGPDWWIWRHCTWRRPRDRLHLSETNRRACPSKKHANIYNQSSRLLGYKKLQSLESY